MARLPSSCSVDIGHNAKPEDMISHTTGMLLNAPAKDVLQQVFFLDEQIFTSEIPHVTNALK